MADNKTNKVDVDTLVARPDLGEDVHTFFAAGSTIPEHLAGNERSERPDASAGSYDNRDLPGEVVVEDRRAGSLGRRPDPRVPGPQLT